MSASRRYSEARPVLPTATRRRPPPERTPYGPTYSRAPMSTRGYSIGAAYPQGPRASHSGYGPIPTSSYPSNPGPPISSAPRGPIPRDPKSTPLPYPPSNEPPRLRDSDRPNYYPPAPTSRPIDRFPVPDRRESRYTPIPMPTPAPAPAPSKSRAYPPPPRADNSRRRPMSDRKASWTPAPSSRDRRPPPPMAPRRESLGYVPRRATLPAGGYAERGGDGGRARRVRFAAGS